MLTCILESRTNKSFLFRAHIELSVMGYNPLPRKLDTVALTSQLSVMVLLCFFVHYIVIRVLRRSGFDAPCSCPARCRKHAVPAIQSTIELKEMNRADRFDSLKAALKESDIRNSRASEGGGNESQSGYSSPVEDLADLAQQDIENDQDVKDRELLEALQRERETVSVLYSELEQERNCSATAASEAMAMISRLQEEKAAVQMEARQFERMVVEKAMYDQEAIEALYELLVSREQEKIALEEEIRVCKEKLEAIVREERRQSLLPEAKADEGRVLPKLESPILVKNENIDTASRGGRGEQSKYVDKFSTTNSQLLTALVQDGALGMEAQLGRRLSSGIRRKGGKSEETDGGKPEFLEKIDTAPRVGRDEESKYVDKVSTTNSQLLSALVQDGGRGMEAQVGRRLSNGSRRIGGKAKETDGGEPEIPEKIGTAPRAGRDEQSKHVDKISTTNSQILSALVQDGGRGMEAQLGRRLSSAIRRKGGKSEEADSCEPEFPEKIDTAPRAGRDEQSKHVDKISTTNSPLVTALGQDGGREMEVQLGLRAPSGIRRKGEKSEETDSGEPEFPEKIGTAPRAGRDEQSKHVDKVSTANGQLLSATVLDGGRGTEAQLGVRPPNGISRKGGKSEEADDGKPEFPGFVSLKRRWGSQEITLKTLEQTKEERRIEDKKRLSVLEYVMKFEQQQQHGVRLLVQMPSVTKHPESAGEFRSKMLSDDVDDRAASLTSGDDEPTSSGLTRDDSLRGGGSFEEEDCGEEKIGNASSSVEDVEDGGRCDERPSCIIAESRGGEVCKDTEDADECAEELVFVHDVYEVQKSPYRVPAPVMADAEMQPATPSDRLGKPDLQSFERDEARDYLSMIHPSHLHEEVEDAEKDSQWEDLQEKVRCRTLRVSRSLGTRAISRLGVEERVQELTHQLKALEVDKHFMKKTIEALRRENVEMKRLQGLSQQSLELRGMEPQDL